MIAFLRSRLWLIVLGIACELLYVFFLLRTFPLTRYFNRLTDVGRIVHHSNAGLLAILAAFISLFVFFIFAWWQARAFQDQATLWLILGFGSIFALTTSFVYPLTSTDIFTYNARALVMVQYRNNPITTPPAAFPKDPLMALAGSWISLSSPYGPLGILLQDLPVVIAGRNLFLALLLYKLMFSLLLMISAFFVYKILNLLAPKLALSGAITVAWNPFTLFEYSINGHNDIAMMSFVVLAIFALLKGRPAWALTLVTASVLIKFSTLPLVPLFFLYSFIHEPTWEKRILYSVDALTTSTALIIGNYAPFWKGWETFKYLQVQVQKDVFSFNLFLHEFSAKQIPLNQAKWIGYVLFGICFLYALWLSSRSFSGLLKGCTLTMFTLLLLATTLFRAWYLICPFMLMIMVMEMDIVLCGFLLVSSSVLTWCVLIYGNYQSTSPTVSSIVYLAIFFPPVLLLSAFRLKLAFAKLCKEEDNAMYA